MNCNKVQHEKYLLLMKDHQHSVAQIVKLQTYKLTKFFNKFRIVVSTYTVFNGVVHWVIFGSFLSQSTFHSIPILMNLTQFPNMQFSFMYSQITY